MLGQQFQSSRRAVVGFSGENENQVCGLRIAHYKEPSGCKHKNDRESEGNRNCQPQCSHGSTSALITREIVSRDRELSG
jgi:hypothetical protein